MGGAARVRGSIERSPKSGKPRSRPEKTLFIQRRVGLRDRSCKVYDRTSG